MWRFFPQVYLVVVDFIGEYVSFSLLSRMDFIMFIALFFPWYSLIMLVMFYLNFWLFKQAFFCRCAFKPGKMSNSISWRFAVGSNIFGTASSCITLLYVHKTLHSEACCSYCQGWIDVISHKVVQRVIFFAVYFQWMIFWALESMFSFFFYLKRSNRNFLWYNATF